MKTEHIDFIDRATAALIEDWRASAPPQAHELIDSIQYSFTSGGKRFRPSFALMVADCYAAGPRRVLPWCLAIEMIHTYSLIHDDLPSIDNDDFRRGRPTNHKVFGESTALLAGDALLTEAFLYLAKSFSREPDLGLKLVALLGEAAGLSGMISGQMIDVASQKNKIDYETLQKMHILKTGALIRAAAEGAALICGLETDLVSRWRKFGEKLGLAFQVKDDLLDAQEKQELGSFPAIIGLQKTNEFLENLNSEMKALLSEIGGDTEEFHQLVEYNRHRKK